MQDITQILGSVSPHVSDVLRQAQTGDPEAVTDADVHQAYSQVAPQLTREQFQQAAAAAFDQLTPDERSQIAEHLRTQSQQQQVQVPNLPSATTAATDPGALAKATAEVNEQAPNMLQQLFAPGGTFSSPLAKAALLGITAFAAQQISKRS